MLYMKITICRVLLAALSLAAAACAGQNPEAILTSADDALSVGDYRSAQSLCDNLSEISRNDSLAMRSKQYCRLAIIYMTLAEHQSESDKSADDNIAAASAMFNCAINISADSVQEFLHSLPPEESGHAELLLQLSEAAQARDKIYMEIQENDSIQSPDHSHSHEI